MRKGRICLECAARDSACPPVLTARERVVLLAVALDSEPLKIVAHRLGITEGTLKQHLHIIYLKLGWSGAASLRKAAAWAREHRALLGSSSVVSALLVFAAEC